MKFNWASIFIWLGIALAFMFPFFGIQLSKFSFYLLFIMGTLNFLPMDWRSLSPIKANYLQITGLLIGSYLLLPGVQMILAKVFFEQQSLQLGVLLAAVAPVAIFVPQLCLPDRDIFHRAVVYVLGSTILFPLICFVFIPLFKFDQMNLRLGEMMRDCLILTLVPLAISFIFHFFGLKSKLLPLISRMNPGLNMFIVGILVFIYFGTSISRGKLLELNHVDSMKLIFIALVQDFGGYFIYRSMGLGSAEVLSFSIKNVALSGGILLIFSPNSVVVCCAIFVAHALFLGVLTYLPKLKS